MEEREESGGRRIGILLLLRPILLLLQPVLLLLRPILLLLLLGGKRGFANKPLLLTYTTLLPLRGKRSFLDNQEKSKPSWVLNSLY
jgi:hypothetical protein